MEITIRRRCGHEVTYWAPDRGGYVRITTPSRPGTLGQQPTWHGGSTLECGPSEEGFSKLVRQYEAYQRRHARCASCYSAEMREYAAQEMAE